MMTRTGGLKSFVSLAPCAAAIVFLTTCTTGLLTSCGVRASGTNSSLEYAYIGPASATLREDLAARSSQVTGVKHGERVEIVDARRRLVRVRTAAGSEGWIDANQLLTPQQMEEFKRVAALAAQLPVQGKATVGDALNAHTGPGRTSPTLFQIPENGAVEVLAHHSSPRTAQVSDVAAAVHAHPAKKIVKPKSKEVKESPENKDGKKSEPSDASKNALPPLPMPAPPAPPANWVRLSVPRLADLEKNEKASAENAPPPPDDWTLIRTPDHQAGWVLSRMLSMSIPDDVIRYTEGRRVTAYLDLGEVPDEGRNKHNWIWATTSARGAAYDFDSFRVLIWNPVKHRYETARAERNLEGLYPLQMIQNSDSEKVGAAAPGIKAEEPVRAGRKKTRAAKTTEKEDRKDEKLFSLLIADADGRHIYRRVYGLAGRRVRLVSTTGVPAPAQPITAASSAYDPLAPPPAQKSWWRAGIDWLKRLGGRRS